MFSYNDPIFQADNTSPVKDAGFAELTSATSPTTNDNSNGPMYAYNDMLYSVEHHNMSTTNLGVHHHQHQPPIVSQHHHQQLWHEQQQQQQQQHHSNPYYTTDVQHQHQQQQQQQQQQQDQSPYDHYNVSPFSSPLINTSNAMMLNNASQRSSIQSLPSVHPIPSTSTSVQQQQQQLQLQQQHHHHQQQQQQEQQSNQRPRITTSLWDDEETVCYQVDVRGICVARRQDNDMVNGTKLLNVTGMSRGKRDGILKNEKGRVVVKVGAMHLKGVWVTFARAKALAIQFNIVDQLHPLFVDDPALYFYSNQLAHNYYIPNHPIYLQSQDSFHQQQQQQQQQQNKRSSSSAYSMYSNNNSNSSLEFPVFHSSSPSPSNYHNQQQQQQQQQQQHPHHLHQQLPPPTQEFHHSLPAAPSVPSMIPVQQQQQQQQQRQMPLYGYTTSTTSSPTSSVAHHHIPISTSSTSTTNPTLATVDSIRNHY